VTPRARFRLYPEAPRGLYVAVNVWPTAATMRKYAAKTGDASAARARRLGGYCACYRIVSYKAGRPQRTKMLVAEVNLYVARIGTEVITHEMFHATMQWGRRIGFDFPRLDADDSVNDDEERLTYAHSTLCRDFVRRAIAAGLYE
jgi:hypothetical protein